MRVAVILLFLFGIVIGTATFIENDYGTQTAKALIYSARWFEVFLFFFILVLLYNIIKYKSYRKGKWSIFIFHISFLIIAIGAAMTRYIGYEGVMHIREGHSANTMVSDVKILQIDVKKGEDKAHFEKPIFFSSMTKNNFSETLSVEDKEVKVELIEYLPSAEQQLVPDPNGKMVIALKISNGAKGQDIHLSRGEIYDADSFIVNFGNSDTPIKGKPYFNIIKTDNGLKLKTDFDLKTLSMLTKEEENLTKGFNLFESKKLYSFGKSNMIVLRKVYDKASKKFVTTSLKTQSGKPEMAVYRVLVGEESQDVNLFAYHGDEGEAKKLTLGGVDIELVLGAKVIGLPFSIKLIDFQLERYPGSNSPSSYASEVELIDEERGIQNIPFKIYMNHVLDHRNYRFFQSSYDRDEQGTILSVNHDPGTLPTYIGYLLMMIGMIWNLFSSTGRFQKLLKRAKKLQGATIVAVALLLLSNTTPAQATTPSIDEKTQTILNAYDKESVEKFGKLVVQDSGGRMKPMDTLAHEIISKVSGKSSIFGVEPASLLLGMTVNPMLYQDVAMIKISHPQIAKELGLDESVKFAKFSDFFNKKDNSYKLSNQVSESMRKKPLEKSQYDKELAKVDERLSVSYMVYMGSLLQIFPVPNDANNKWVNPQEAIKIFPEQIGTMVRQMTMHLFQGVEIGVKDNNWSNTQEALHLISLYQTKFGNEVIPSDRHIEIEIEYNKLGLLSKLVPLYLLVGILLLLFAFIHVIKPTFPMKRIMQVAWNITIFGFIIHLIGMGMRWYISGHAPWSNSYESIVFIAASTVMAGLFFAKKSPFTLAATTLLAGITMGVAHMNFINPEITNLVPVLKSYWLMIHVATIISGDGFLGLGSILSMLVLILFIMRKEGHDNIDRSIKELTSIAEMSLIIGLFLLTIGNFLGGVWANESWGRYWGWDAKETWAAVSILIYATVLHLRFIPRFNNPFVFNVASLWAYSSVLMTYFGVNYYLSGLHSYAAGEPIPIPNWVYYGIVGLGILTLLAYRNRKLK